MLNAPCTQRSVIAEVPHVPIVLRKHPFLTWTGGIAGHLEMITTNTGHSYGFPNNIRRINNVANGMVTNKKIATNQLQEGIGSPKVQRLNSGISH